MLTGGAQEACQARRLLPIRFLLSVLALACRCVPISASGTRTLISRISGIALVGVALAFGYTLFARTRAQPIDQLAILACALSHFALEWPAHRADVDIVPGDHAHVGLGLFDHPAVLFALELVLFFPTLWAYARFAAPSARAGTRNKSLVRTVVAVFLGQQAQFCFTA
jgi:hypothetical protein